MFLRDIVNKRKEVDLPGNRSASLSQLSNFDKNNNQILSGNATTSGQLHNAQKNKKLLEGQSIKSSMTGWTKKTDEYDHYDNVVKDLLSEIKLRK